MESGFSDFCYQRTTLWSPQELALGGDSSHSPLVAPLAPDKGNRRIKYTGPQGTKFQPTPAHQKPLPKQLLSGQQQDDVLNGGASSAAGRLVEHFFAEHLLPLGGMGNNRSVPAALRLRPGCGLGGGRALALTQGRANW